MGNSILYISCALLLLYSIPFVVNRKAQQRRLGHVNYRFVDSIVEPSFNTFDDRYSNIQQYCPEYSSPSNAFLYLLLPKSVIGGYFLFSALFCVLSTGCISVTYKSVSTVQSTTESLSSTTELTTTTLKTTFSLSTTQSSTKSFSTTSTTTDVSVTSKTSLTTTTTTSFTTSLITLSRTSSRNVLTTSTSYKDTKTEKKKTSTSITTVTINGKKKRSIQIDTSIDQGLCTVCILMSFINLVLLQIFTEFTPR